MNLKVITAILFISPLSWSGGSDIGNSGGQTSSSNPLSQTIECTGNTAKGVRIGIHATLGPVDDLEELATFEREAVSIEDVRIQNTSYLKTDKNGEVLVFALKTYNDGLETNDRVEYIKSSSRDSVLELGYRGELKAVSNIICKILN